MVAEIIKLSRAWTEICNTFFHVHWRPLSNLKNVLLYLSKQKQKLRPSFSSMSVQSETFSLPLRFVLPLKDVLEFKKYHQTDRLACQNWMGYY